MENNNGKDDKKYRWHHKESANRPTRKGSKNLFSKHAKDAIKRVFNIEINKLSRDLGKMTEKDKWATMIQLMKYVIPALTENKNKLTGAVQYEISYDTDVKDDFEIGETTIDELLDE